MLDITDYLYRTFDSVLPYGNPQTDWSITCPFCDDSHNHMNVSINKEAVHCFRCGYSNSWVGFVMQYSGLPYHKALSELYRIPHMKEFGSITKNITGIIPREKKIAQLPLDFTLIGSHDKSYNIQRKYLIRRGVGEDMWDRYSLGVAESIQGRVIIPIEKGYWQGRSVYSWLKPKYINPKVEAREVLFNSVALQNYDEIVICEGAFSAMAVGDNAVALIGKEPTEEKLLRLQNAEVGHYIIALEQNAWKTVQRLAEGLFKSGKRITIWRFSIGDPADKLHKFDVLEYDLKTRIMLDMNYQV